METIASQNLSQGNVDTVMKVLQMQAENARASMNAGVATRGQDMDQATAMRNQDLQRANALTDANTAMRGQDLQAQSWGEKNAIDKEQMLNSAEYQKGMLENQAKLTEIQQGDLELKQKQEKLKEAKNLLISDAFEKGGWDGMKAALASTGEFKMALDIQDSQDRLNQQMIANERADRNDAVDNAGKMADAATKDYSLRKLQVGDYVGQQLAAVVNMEDGPEKQQAILEIANKGNQLMGYEIFNPKNPGSALIGMQAAAMNTGQSLKENPMKGLEVYGNEEWNRRKQELNQGNNQQGLNINFDAEGKVTDISTGGRGNKTAENKAIDTLNDSAQFGADLASVREAFKPELLGWAAKGKDFYVGLKDKADFELSDEELDFVNKREELITYTEQMFNSYRKVITGAAASEKELANLRETFINGDLGSARFQARMNAMFKKWEKDVDRKVKSLQQGGVDTSVFNRDNSFSDSPNNKVDRAVNAGEDRRAQLEARRAELLRSQEKQ